MDYEALCNYEAEHLSSAHDHRPSDKGRGGGGGGGGTGTRKERECDTSLCEICLQALSLSSHEQLKGH